MTLPQSRTVKTWIIYLLFALASVHCARSIFYVNVSQIELLPYEQGIERMPFQGRVAMVPVLRWAHRNRTLGRAAGVLDRNLRKGTHMENPPEDWTPEKLVCLLFGIVSVCAITASAVWFGRRHMAVLWWLPGVLTLAMLYVTYAARYEVPYWYPYDLPHFAVFGIACMLLLEDMLLPALFCFLVDLPIRETSIYLVPVVLALGYSRRRMGQAVLASAGMCAVWLPVHLWIDALYAHNLKDTGVHWTRLFVLFWNPLHWPQLGSAFAFLALPLYFGRRYATRSQRFFLLGAIPCLLSTLTFGIWHETRVWGEWTLPASLILATEFARKYPPGEAGPETTSN